MDFDVVRVVTLGSAAALHTEMQSQKQNSIDGLLCVGFKAEFNNEQSVIEQSRRGAGKHEEEFKEEEKKYIYIYIHSKATKHKLGCT